jgi:hypothetical protein
VSCHGDMSPKFGQIIKQYNSLPVDIFQDIQKLIILIYERKKERRGEYIFRNKRKVEMS